MISRCPNQTGLRVATLVGLLVVAAAPSSAQQPGGHPFDGEWSLVWDVTTAPGGATISIPGGIFSPYNTAYHAAKKQFQVNEDGSIEWAQSDAGSMYHNGTFNANGASYPFLGARKLHLRAAGKAQAPRTATGELRAEDRRLALDLMTMGGSGYSSGTTHASMATIVANIDDREQGVFPTNGGAHRAPNPPWTLKWQDLKPSVVSEELAPDVIRQTFTYEVTRQVRIPEEVAGKLNPLVTERIEIKHVHYPRLVPRG